MKILVFYFVFLCLATLTSIQQASAQGGALNVVKTGITVHHRGKIAVGDSIIAFGTGINTGVDYIRIGDKQGRGIPGGDQFSATNFVVAGEKIVLINTREFTFHVFDTKTGTMSEVPGLKNRGNSPLKVSGNYVAAVTMDETRNRNTFSVIDVGGAEPNVAVNQPPWSGAIRIDQVAIDAPSGNLVVSTGDQIARVLFKTGDTEPIVHQIREHGNAGTEAIAVSGDMAYYFSAESGQKNLMEINLVNGSVRKLGVNPATSAVAAAGGTVAYFANRDAKDRSSTHARLAVARKGGAPTIAVAADRFVDGRTRNNGLHGFGNTVAVTPDGRRVFVSGKDAVGRTDRLQVYEGTTMRLFPDPSVNPAFLQATDVAVSATLAAFKTGADANTTLGYIRLR
ncbi:MAG TPA: hypothetical protein PKD24_13755 [Pyrinomonadaceae bacterium]|nr:hypothetical protein [Pyrinomonadaceae bacterium]HMP66555.1 hypothetical protein [Pyrinomonadaceae bacterium]